MTKKALEKALVIPEKYVTAVNEGVKFLDFVVGRKKWLRKMHMRDFNIEDGATCVAGNVFRDGSEYGDSGYERFIDALETLGADSSKMSDNLGFSANTAKGNQYLQDLWVRKIKALKRNA